MTSTLTGPSRVQREKSVPEGQKSTVVTRFVFNIKQQRKICTRIISILRSVATKKFQPTVMKQAKVTPEITGKSSATKTSGVATRRFNSSTSIHVNSWQCLVARSDALSLDKWKFAVNPQATQAANGRLWKGYSYIQMKLLNKTFTPNFKLRQLNLRLK